MKLCLALTGKQQLVVWILVTLFVSGCASTHKPFNLTARNYGPVQQLGDSIRISYANSLQYVSGNRWYSKKENKYNMRAISIKLENAYSVPVRITPEDLRVYANNKLLPYLMPEDYSAKVKQRVGVHLLHTLYGPWSYSVSHDPYGKRDVNFFFLPVGAIIGIGNAIRANKANKANAGDIRRLLIWNQTAQPGEIVYGIILVPAAGSDQLTFATD
jgi:hypothetical protein